MYIKVPLTAGVIVLALSYLNGVPLQESFIFGFGAFAISGLLKLAFSGF